MGLDISHGCWHGAYSAFSRWRHKIAELVGIPLDLMDGFYEPPNPEAMEWASPRPGGPLCKDAWGPSLHHWIETIASGLPLSWDLLELDPLVVLLTHADNEGTIEPGDCGPIARRLEELLPELAKLPDDPGHIGNWAETTRKFIDGLRAAAEAGEEVRFH